MQKETNEAFEAVLALTGNNPEDMEQMHASDNAFRVRGRIYLAVDSPISFKNWKYIGQIGNYIVYRWAELEYEEY